MHAIHHLVKPGSAVDYRQLSTIRSVSHQWDVRCTSYPPLWTTLAPDMPHSLALEAVARSQDAPLDIHYPSAPTSRPDQVPRPTFPQSFPPYVLATSYRWRSLNVVIHLDQDTILTPLLSRPTPNLQSFHLTLPPEHTSIIPRHFSDPHPKLRELTFNGTFRSFSWYTILVGKLETLRLLDVEFQFTSLVYLLRTTHILVHLDLDIIHCLQDTTLPKHGILSDAHLHTPAVYLNSVQTARIRSDSAHWIRSLIDLLQLPATVDLSLLVRTDRSHVPQPGAHSPYGRIATRLRAVEAAWQGSWLEASWELQPNKDFSFIRRGPYEFVLTDVSRTEVESSSDPELRLSPVRLAATTLQSTTMPRIRAFSFRKTTPHTTLIQAMGYIYPNVATVVMQFPGRDSENILPFMKQNFPRLQVVALLWYAPHPNDGITPSTALRRIWRLGNWAARDFPAGNQHPSGCYLIQVSDGPGRCGPPPCIPLPM